MAKRKFINTNDETYDKKGRLVSQTRNTIKFEFKDGIYIKEGDDHIVTYNYYYNQGVSFYDTIKGVIHSNDLFSMERVKNENGVSTSYEFSSFCDEEMTQLVYNSLCTISEDGHGVSNVLNEYDDKGRITRQITTYNRGYDVSETTYHENGSKTISYTSIGKKKLYKNTREYNFNDDIIREYPHDDFNNPLVVSSYEYYEGTNIMKSSKTIYSDDPNKLYLSYYDDRGDILYSYKIDRFCNGSSSLEVLESHVYDMNGRIIKSYSCEYGSINYNYESDKTTITQVDDTDDYRTPKTTVTTIYLNEDGEPIRSEKVENGKTISVTTYHYNNIIRYNDMNFNVKIRTEEIYNENTKEVYTFVRGRTHDNIFEISRGCMFIEYKHADSKVYFDKRFINTTLVEYYEDGTTRKSASETSEVEY